MPKVEKGALRIEVGEKKTLVWQEICRCPPSAWSSAHSWLRCGEMKVSFRDVGNCVLPCVPPTNSIPL